MKTNSRFVVIILVGVLALLTLFVGCEDPPVVEALQSVEGVAISGDAHVGGTLQAIPDPAGAKVFYQWLISDTETEDFKEISGAVGSTYEVDAEDLGKFVKVRVTGRNNFIGTVSSVAVEIEAAPIIPITAIGAITGELVVGQTLTAGAVTPAGAAVDYQWMASETEDGEYVAITDATNSTYVIDEDYADHFIKVQVTGKETENFSGTITSTAVGPVISIDQATADEVDVLIAALPATVTLEDKVQIEAARAAYDALTPAQQALVDDVAALVAAESELAALEAAAALVSAKSDAKTELASYDGGSTNYTTNAEAYATAIAAGNTAIDAATTIAEVDIALGDAKAVIDGIESEADIAAAANQDDVDAAIVLVEDADPIASIEIAGGAGATDTDKAAAVETLLEDLAGMSALGVTIDVTWNDVDGKFDVNITKGSADEDTQIAVTKFVKPQAELDEDAVDAAILKVPATIDTLIVSGGSGAETGDKEDAVKDYLEALEGMAALDVTIAVALDSGSTFDVTISKNAASDDTQVEVTAFVKPQA